MADQDAIRLHARTKDLTGATFGNWTVLGPGGVHRKQRHWKCRCVCGTEREVAAYPLTKGDSTSCGCIGNAKTAARNLIHGLRHLPEYAVWNTMIQRCHNPNASQFPDYGARGIAVCDRWRESFEAFYADMGQRPTSRHTIERKDNNDGYHPGNCVWETRAKQARNKRNLRLFTFNGETHCIAEWAEIIGIPAKTLNLRLMRRKWSVEKALTTPLLTSRYGTIKQVPNEV
jgi:hypothetical protein